MSEKSGMELLSELLEKVTLLEKRFANQEQNIKELLNRSNSKISVTGVIAPQTKPQKVQEPVKATTKVIGKVKTEDGKLVTGASVKIFDENNNIVKETKTNRAGELMCFLSPGNYKAEYFLENIVNASLSFKIEPGQQIMRLGTQE